MNVVLTKFLKLYLNVPFHTNNALVYHVTESITSNQDLENDYIRENMRVEQKMMEIIPDYVFSTFSTSNRHIKSLHDKEQEYNCNKCNYKAKDNSSFEVHI